MLRVLDKGKDGMTTESSMCLIGSAQGANTLDMYPSGQEARGGEGERD